MTTPPDNPPPPVPPPPPPPPIDYAPRPASTPRGGEIAAGVIAGVVTVTALGFFVAVVVDESTPAAWDLHSKVAGAAFFALAGVGLTLFFSGMRNRVQRRWFFLSLSLGAGVMALIEGACFMQ